jgi:hypothetical protein
VASIAAALLAGRYAVWNWWRSRASSTAQIRGEPIATRAVGELAVRLYGHLHNGQTEVLVRFTDSSGRPKDVGQLKTELSHKMPGIAMRFGSDATKTNKPGVFRTKLEPQIYGDWAVKFSWQGSVGEGQVEIPVNVKH